MQSTWRRTIIFFVIVAILFSAALFLLRQVEQNSSSPALADSKEVLHILLDPGHGGEDGGAVGYSGSIEKNLNLAISLQLRELLTFIGFEVEMTRDTDTARGDTSLGTIRERKVSDMYERLELYNSNTQALVISVHMNNYGDKSVRGVQVFYSQNTAESQALGQSVQSAVATQLHPENKFVLKPAEKNLFLLFHSKTPAILIECGFVSNPDEEALLKSSDYQRQMAFAILSGVMDYINS